jgi:hypothetical protein
MVLAGLFATVLFIGLILGDWLYFVRFTPDAIRYGCSVARSHDRWTAATIETVRSRFSADGVLMLPHGIARFYPDVSQIAIRPQYRFFSIGFRSAWPVKGLIHLSAGCQAGDYIMDTLCVKRIPWSSALMTLLWFGVVVIGSLMFVVTYAWDGGFASLEGMLMGLGLVAGAVIVVAAGLVTVTMSYRLEHNRLMNVYEELRHAVEGPLRPIPEAPQL